MSLDKGIEHGKEHRKQYYKKLKLWCPCCRSGGSCDYCRLGRLHHVRSKERAAKQAILEWELENYDHQIVNRIESKK